MTTTAEGSFTDFLRCIRNGDTDRLAKVHQTWRTKAAMAESSGALGGFLVPQQLRADLFATVEEEAIVRPRATVVPMGSRSMLLPYPDAETLQSTGVPPYFGGLNFNWTAEAATRTETEPAWRQKDLVAWDLSGYCLASNPWLDDTTKETDAFLKTLFARAIAWHEDYAFLRGDGVGKPLGLVVDGIAGGAIVSRTTPSTFIFADAATMVSKLLPGSWPRAIWAMHPLALAKLVALATSTTAVWQANQARTEGTGPVGWLHTMPVYVTDKLPTLGTPGDVILFDPMLYVIGDRLQIEVAVSADEPTAFLKNQTAFRILCRVGGRPWLSAGVRGADASTTCYQAVILS